MSARYNLIIWIEFQIAGLLILMVISWLVASLIFMLVPVWLGRQAFQLWLADSPKIYELYTAALGLVILNYVPKNLYVL